MNYDRLGLLVAMSMDTNSYITYKLRKILNLYIYCLQLYCKSIKQPNKNPVQILVITKKLIAINQRLKDIAKEAAKQNT